MSSLEDTNYPKEQKDAGISRRKFLEAAAGALAVAGLAAGCSDAAATETQVAVEPTAEPTVASVAPTTAPVAEATTVAAVETVAAPVERPYQLHEADVLVIGGGISGLFAAKKAMEEGASVIILDKGPFGHSGTSGINWGHDMETNEWAEDDGSATLGSSIYLNDGMPDQTYDLSLVQHVHEAKPVCQNEMVGNIAERGLDGNPVGQNAPIAMTVDHGCFVRAFAQHAQRMGAKIFDRTMVVDVLRTENGDAAGAVAISLATGEAVVVRAKATIMATGSYAWCYGWAGNGAYSIAGPENTGDGLSMFLNMGMEMRDMEQLPVDFVQWYPKGTSMGMGTMGLSIVNHQYALNKNGERYTQIQDTDFAGHNAIFMRLTMKEINEGRGLDNGCIYVDTTHNDDVSMDRYYRRVRANEKRFLNYDLPEKTEVHWEMWESAARPAATTATGETPVAGLFYAGASTQAYSGCAWMGCVGSGYMSGKSAAQRAAEVDRPGIVWSQVQDSLNRAYGVLEAQPAEAVRPIVVYHKIQQAMFDGLSPLRNEESIQGAIDALNKIKEEDFPKIGVPTKNRQYNQEWRYAMEIPNMWNCVMGTAQAALIRKETRGTHCRTDYPKMDNANWLVNTIVKVQDGAWSAETRPIVATVIPVDQVAAMVPQIGID